MLYQQIKKQFSIVKRWKELQLKLIPCNMKGNKSTSAIKLSSCFVALLTFSCVNSIEEESTQQTRVPISFVSQINIASVTKVNNNAFEAEDEVGLYAIITGQGLAEERYIDNLRLETEEDGNALFPEEDVFYPDGGGHLDFYAYYPYKEDALPEGSATLPIEIKQDQSAHEDYSKSDYLVAVKTDVANTESTVNLTFRHILSKLKVELLPQGDTSLEKMKSANPRIVACGFYSQANYDLEEGTFSNMSAPTDIVAAGEWEIQGEKLVGKNIILLPQVINSERQSIALEWNGNIYTCSISLTELVKNTQRTITIKVEEVTDAVLSGVMGDIEPWTDNPEVIESDGNLELTAIHTNALSFEPSSVYRIYTADGNYVAEICKEYLLANNIASQAIVVYPLAEENTTTRPGYVLKIVGETENVHGGMVRWNKNTNDLTYLKGDSAPIETFYIESDGTLSFEDSGTTESVRVSDYQVNKSCGGVHFYYPIVKVGTQYWMRDNLDITKTDKGDNLPHLEKQVEGGVSGYFHTEGSETYLYNGELLLELKNELAPQGCRIPTTADWEQLRNYVRRDVSVLKSGEWKPFDSTPDILYPGNNLSGFNGLPVGTWVNGKPTSVNSMVGYWTLEEDGTIPDLIYNLTARDLDFVTATPNASQGNYYKALSIRCIVEP